GNLHRRRHAELVLDERPTYLLRSARNPSLLTHSVEDIHMYIKDLVRRVSASGMMAAAMLFASSCDHVKDQLLDPQQPGVIGPGSVGSAIGAEALVVGA